MADNRKRIGTVRGAFDIIGEELPRWWKDINAPRKTTSSGYRSVMAPIPYKSNEVELEDITLADALEFGLMSVPQAIAAGLLYSPEAEGAPKVGGAGKSGLLGKVGKAFRQVVAPDAKRAGQRIGSGQNAGQIIGAPPGVNTPSALAAWRKDLYAGMKEGAEAGGRPWYDDTSRYIYEVSGHLPERADRASFLSSLYSQSNKVPSELGQTVRAWNQHLVGDPIYAGRYPNTMRPKAEKILTEPTEELRLNIKTDPYALNKSVAWNPGVAHQRSVIDRHQMTGYGYGKENPTQAQNEFFNQEMSRAVDRANREGLLGYRDWNLSNAQASTWMPAKAEKDTISAIEKAQKAGKPLTPAQIVNKYREALKNATKSFKDFSPQYEAQLTGSYIPAAGAGGSGHLPELVTRPYEEQQRFSGLLSQVNRGPGGNDRVATGMGMLNRPPLASPGEYEGLMEPDYALRLLVGRAPETTAMDPSSRKALEAVAGGRGLMDVQKQMAYNYSHNPIGAGKAEAVEFLPRTAAPIGEAEMRNLAEALRSAIPDLALGAPQPTTLGGRMLNFGPGLTDEQAKTVKAVAGKQGLRPSYSESNMGIFPTAGPNSSDAPAAFSTRPYIDAIKAGGPKMVQGFDETVMDVGGGLARQQLAAVQHAAEQMNLTSAPWYTTAMRILAREGIEGIDRAQKAGVIPAIALSTISGLLAATQGVEGPP